MWRYPPICHSSSVHTALLRTICLHICHPYQLPINSQYPTPPSSTLHLSIYPSIQQNIKISTYPSTFIILPTFFPQLSIPTNQPLQQFKNNHPAIPHSTHLTTQRVTSLGIVRVSWGGFLDPKARGMNLGYDQAVALPAMQADGKSGQEDIFKETNKAMVFLLRMGMGMEVVVVVDIIGSLKRYVSWLFGVYIEIDLQMIWGNKNS